MACATLLGVFGVIQVIRAVTKKTDPEERYFTATPKALATIALIAGITAGYALVVKTLGFILTTVPYMGISIYALGKRRLVVVLIFSVAATAVIYVVMQLIFGVPLPRGLIERLFM
jgi:hypothetical protein